MHQLLLSQGAVSCKIQRMQTDKVPKNASTKDQYLRSDSMRKIGLPPAEPSRTLALRIKEALANDDRKALQIACKDLLHALSDAYNVKPPGIKVLAARPRKVTDAWVTETFGDYDPETTQIRLWMRTAVQKKATSYGTFLSTLCHEFCHHLDMVSLELPDTFHTRGFYERTAWIYHHIQNTPVRQIVWQSQSDGTYSVNWAGTMRAPAIPVS
ncbi:MAG: hypothetical protein SGJ27_17485 [Candidatus Melainabacteria bacterium]|nr:hypothetical protein [Candidatus Melainabacteria bacterium]